MDESDYLNDLVLEYEKSLICYLLDRKVRTKSYRKSIRITAPGSKYNMNGMQWNTFQLFLVEQIRKYTHPEVNITGDARTGMQWERHASSQTPHRYVNAGIEKLMGCVERTNPPYLLHFFYNI